MQKYSTPLSELSIYDLCEGRRIIFHSKFLNSKFEGTTGEIVAVHYDKGTLQIRWDDQDESDYAGFLPLESFDATYLVEEEYQEL